MAISYPSSLYSLYSQYCCNSFLSLLLVQQSPSLLWPYGTYYLFLGLIWKIVPKLGLLEHLSSFPCFQYYLEYSTKLWSVLVIPFNARKCGSLYLDPQIVTYTSYVCIFPPALSAPTCAMCPLLPTGFPPLHCWCAWAERELFRISRPSPPSRGEYSYEIYEIIL